MNLRPQVFSLSLSLSLCHDHCPMFPQLQSWSGEVYQPARPCCSAQSKADNEICKPYRTVAAWTGQDWRELRVLAVTLTLTLTATTPALRHSRVFDIL